MKQKVAIATVAFVVGLCFGILFGHPSSNFREARVIPIEELGKGYFSPTAVTFRPVVHVNSTSEMQAFLK